MRALSFGEGFVDISMYLALAGPSKNTACMRPNYLRCIFRKIRLAVFWQLCRLPIGLGSLRAGTRGCFPILRCRMSGIENRIVAAAAGVYLAAAKPVAGIFRPIFSRVPGAGGQIGETPGVASDPPGWTCVLYLRCKPRCPARHFGRRPQGGFGRPVTLVSSLARPKQEQATEKWGDCATQASGLNVRSDARRSLPAVR
jgi:hypothetical protein